MLEAIWYGIVAALAFIGFLAIVYFVVLSIYKPRGNESYMLSIPNQANRNEISSLIYGAHMRNMLFGDLVSDDIIVVDCELDEDRRKIVEEVSKDCGSIKICTVEEIKECLYRKENDGR